MGFPRGDHFVLHKWLSQDNVFLFSFTIYSTASQFSSSKQYLHLNLLFHWHCLSLASLLKQVMGPALNFTWMNVMKTCLDHISTQNQENFFCVCFVTFIFITGKHIYQYHNAFRYSNY